MTSSSGELPVNHVLGYQVFFCIVWLFAFCVFAEEMGTLVVCHNLDFSVGILPAFLSLCFPMYLRTHGKQHRTSTRGRCLPTAGKVNGYQMVAPWALPFICGAKWRLCVYLSTCTIYKEKKRPVTPFHTLQGCSPGLLLSCVSLLL